MRARVHRLHCQLGVAGPVVLIVAGDDEHGVELLAGQHLPVVRVSVTSAELPRERGGALRLQVTDGDEVNRRILERGEDVAVGVATAADEANPHFAVVLEIVRDSAVEHRWSFSQRSIHSDAALPPSTQRP